MKIGIDARMYRSGVAGIGRYSQNLIKNLLAIEAKGLPFGDREDEFVLFMTQLDKKEFENFLIENSMKIENLKLKIVSTDTPHFSLAEQIHLAKILEKENLDLMHFLNFNFPVRYRGKFITTIHDLTLLFYPQTARNINFLKFWGYRYVMEKAVQGAEKIIAVSQSTKKDIIKIFHVPPEKIEVVYEAADDKSEVRNQKSEVRKKYHITKPILLYVGQFRQHKNIRGLLKAFEILEKTKPCQLVLLGGKRADLSQDERAILDRAKFSRDIIMPGFVSDQELVTWYQSAAVLVFPSFYEGFGLPGLEAMMAGTPVVSSRTASLPEIYQQAALYFDPFNPQDIAAKIKMILEDENLRRKLIKNGRKVAQKYSWRKTAEKTLKLYKQIQGSKSKCQI